MKVEGREDLHKNPHTGVVHYNINKNNMTKIRQAKKEKKREVEQLKDEVKEIKSMLKTLMEKL